MQTDSYQLPSHISKLLDELEQEEELELNNRSIEQANPSQSDDTTHEFITPEDIGQEVDKALNLNQPVSYHSTKQDDQELKEWGKTGLDGLKNIFKSSSSSLSVTSPQQLDQSSAGHPLNSIIAKNNRTQDLISQDDHPTSKPSSKKSVTFAPETNFNPPKSTTPTSDPILPAPPQPSPGIMLTDIIEHPLVQPTVIPSTKPTQPTKIEINGHNGHLNPRLASLLPRSLQNRSSSNPESQQEEEDDDDDDDDGNAENEDQEDSDGDEIHDGSSAWSDDDDEAEGGSCWPPDGQDIETALDLRQAALEYHTKRQGLGLGRGTGPLGGDRAPGSDDEREWVPLDTRVQGPGVPRGSTGKSRFKTGRSLHPLEGTTHTDFLGGDQKVVDGKLFGAAPIIEGPAPTKGAAVHQLPGRSADFSELDDELTAEEVELLRSRLEALGMDEESRIVAERAGSELMAWMEKARTGQVKLEDEADDPNDPLINPPQPSTIERSFQNQGPPEIKTVPKSTRTRTAAVLKHQPLPQTTSQQQQEKKCMIKSMGDDPASAESNPEDPPPILKKVSRFKASKIHPTSQLSLS